MIIPLKEYAELYGINRNTLLHKFRRGDFKTAHQVGRAWLVDSEELPVFKRTLVNEITPNPETSLTDIPDGYVGIADYAELNGFTYNQVSRKAVFGLFKSLITIAEKRYLDPNESLPTSRKVKSGKYIGFRNKIKQKKQNETD